MTGTALVARGLNLPVLADPYFAVSGSQPYQAPALSNLPLATHLLLHGLVQRTHLGELVISDMWQTDISGQFASSQFIFRCAMPSSFGVNGWAPINPAYCGIMTLVTRSKAATAEPRAESPSSVAGKPDDYSRLHGAINDLEMLEARDPHSIDSTTARSTRLFLNLLCLYSVPAPQIFPHGGDAVTFKWIGEGQPDKYVTYGDNVAILREYRSGIPVAGPLHVDTRSQVDLLSLMLRLGGKQWRATVKVA